MVKFLKKKKREIGLQPGFTSVKRPGKEKEFAERESKTISTGINKSKTIFGKKGKRVTEEEATGPTFIPSAKAVETSPGRFESKPQEEISEEERIAQGTKKRREETISAIESGTIDEATGRKLLKELDVDQNIEQMDGTPEQKGIVHDIARLGLLPAVISANVISSGLRLTTGADLGQTTTEEVASTTLGKALGIGTVAAVTTLTGLLAFKALFPATAGNIAAGNTAGLGVTAKKAQVSSEIIAKMTNLQKIGVIKKASGFLRRHKVAVGAISATQLLTAWLSSDNIITGAGIQASGIEKDLIFGNLSSAEAEPILDDLQRNKNVGTFFMKAAVFTNPFLLAFSKAYLTNANQAQGQLDRARARAGLL